MPDAGFVVCSSNTLIILFLASNSGESEARFFTPYNSNSIRRNVTEHINVLDTGTTSAATATSVLFFIDYVRGKDNSRSNR